MASLWASQDVPVLSFVAMRLTLLRWDSSHGRRLSLLLRRRTSLDFHVESFGAMPLTLPWRSLHAAHPCLETVLNETSDALEVANANPGAQGVEVMTGSCREPDAIDDDRMEVTRMNRWMWCVLIVVVALAPAGGAEAQNLTCGIKPIPDVGCRLSDRALHERGEGTGV
jgi:hypothetical protein